MADPEISASDRDRASLPAGVTTRAKPHARRLRTIDVDDEAWRAALSGGASTRPTPKASAPEALLVVVADSLGAAVEPLLDPAADIDLIRLAVVDVDVAVRGPVAAGARPNATSSIVGRAEHALGTTTTVQVDVDVDGAPVCTTRVTFLARAPRRRESPDVVAARAADDDARFAAQAQRFVDDVTLAADAPAALARACGNDDPIGLDDDVARMAGLPAPVVPLAGVIALAWDAVARHVVDRAVRGLHVELRRPLLGGDIVRFDARVVDDAHLRLRVQHAPGSAGEGFVAVVDVEFA